MWKCHLELWRSISLSMHKLLDKEEQRSTCFLPCHLERVYVYPHILKWTPCTGSITGEPSQVSENPTGTNNTFPPIKMLEILTSIS